jgi:hypothetical protein
MIFLKNQNQTEKSDKKKRIKKLRHTNNDGQNDNKSEDLKRKK